MILVVDCYDSFVYNLVEYISFFDNVKVLSKENAKEAKKLDFDGIVISPGPGKPSKELDFLFDFGVPILGVCLGHQIIAEVFGG
ncbi:MAG: aminodeoxychorismate/anthranilate synthase component II, partial [Archaeoglobaceae archaeon]